MCSSDLLARASPEPEGMITSWSQYRTPITPPRWAISSRTVVRDLYMVCDFNLHSLEKIKIQIIYYFKVLFGKLENYFEHEPYRGKLHFYAIFADSQSHCKSISTSHQENIMKPGEETIKTIQGRLEVLEKTLVSEENSVQYYETLLKNTPENTEENIGARKMYADLQNEENGHVKRIKELTNHWEKKLQDLQKLS